MFRGKKLLLSMSLMALNISVISCIGIEGGDDDTPTNTSQTTKTYLAYKSSLHLVDPDNPTAQPIEITNKPLLDGAILPVFSKYDFTTNQFEDFHVKGGLFITEEDGDTASRNGGKIYRLYIEKENSTPVAEQVSNITNACVFRDWFIQMGENLYVVVETSGNDKDCFTKPDNQKYIVNMNMNASDNPIDLSGKNIIDAYDFTDIKGFIYQDANNGNVYKCDTNLKNCIQFSGDSLGSSPIEYIGWDINNKYLYICGFNGSPNIYKLDINNNSIINTNEYCDYGMSDTLVDKGAIYFAIENYSTSPPTFDIYKFSLSDGRTSRLTSLSYDGGRIYLYGLTDNYIIVYNDNTYSNKLNIWAVKKDTGQIEEIENNTDVEKFIGDVGLGYKNMFLYSKISYGTTYMCFWKEGDPSSNCKENHMHIAVILPQDSGYMKLGESGFFPGLGVNISSGIDFLVADLSSRAIYLVDGDDINNITKIGDIPSGYKVDTIFPRYGKKFLIPLIDEKTGNRDIFMVDLENKKIIQITNTPDKDEYP